MANHDLSGDAVKLVRWTVVSIEPDDARLLASGKQLVDDDLSPDAFSQTVLARKGVQKRIVKHGVDAKYIRVQYEVEQRWPQPDPKYQKRTVLALEGIRDSIGG